MKERSMVARVESTTMFKSAGCRDCDFLQSDMHKQPRSVVGRVKRGRRGDI